MLIRAKAFAVTNAVIVGVAAAEMWLCDWLRHSSPIQSGAAAYAVILARILVLLSLIQCK